ncbi:hypothetical protein CHU98_g677 [Xylaria longipes]|nr:hypothetical protein CHU98_g677 [Xylaria longipes]
MNKDIAQFPWIRLKVYARKDYRTKEPLTSLLHKAYKRLTNDYITLDQFKVFTWWFLNMRARPKLYSDSH